MTIILNEAHSRQLELPQQRDVRKLVQRIRYPQPGNFLCSAHRGYRWDGTAENSQAAIRKAADAGMICIEVDVRMTSDGVPVVAHDPTLGRTTDIAHVGMPPAGTIYSPFTGKGYSPNLSETPWKGLLEHLKLKDEKGNVVEEGVLRFDQMLDFVESSGISIVIFMDIKEKKAILSSIEWCVWKLFVHFYPMPDDLEKEAWWQDAVSNNKPLYIPVYEPFSARMIINPLESCKAWSLKPYVLALEIGLRAPGGFMQDLLDYATSPECPIKSVGFFAALGDLWPWNGGQIKFDTGDINTPWDIDDHYSKLCFLYTDSPKTHDKLLVEGDSPEGHDYRGDLDLYKSLGFTWTITDRGEEWKEKGIVTV
ncbi:hypothetical protein IAT38_005507 [Cryptococcus sp. DSM 104549]